MPPIMTTSIPVPSRVSGGKDVPASGFMVTATYVFAGRPLPERRRQRTCSGFLSFGNLRPETAYVPLFNGPVRSRPRRYPMFHWAAVFLGVAILAVILGFGSVVGSVAGFAQGVFILFFVAFLTTTTLGLMYPRPASLG